MYLKITLAVFCLLWSFLVFPQNLISNPSFEQNGYPSGEPWKVVCYGCVFRYPLSQYLDTPCGLPVCQVQARQDVPAGGGTWSVYTANLALETYVTGLDGENIYQLSAFVKATGCGVVLGGFRGDSLFYYQDFLLSKNIDSIWKQGIITDTLNFLPTDTLVIIFAVQGLNAYEELWIDNVEFKKISINGINENNSDEIKFMISKETQASTLNVFFNSPVRVLLFQVCDIMGEEIYTTSNVKTNKLSAILNSANGIYIIKIQTENGVITRKIIL